MRSLKVRNKIYPQFWYVCDLKVITKPRIYITPFKTKADAHRAIVKVLKGNFKRYEPIEGEVAKKYDFPWVKFKHSRSPKHKKALVILKYEYPKERNTNQRRKTYRTIMRRRLRK